MSDALSAEKDPYAMLATFSYVFCGLRINDICDRFVIPGKDGTRMASREYVRQKIVCLFQRVQESHIDSFGHTSVAPMYRGGDSHCVGSMTGLSIDTEIKIPVVEEEIHASEEDPDEEAYRKARAKKAKKGQAKGPSTSKSQGRSGPGDRPGDPIHGVVDIEDIPGD